MSLTRLLILILAGLALVAASVSPTAAQVGAPSQVKLTLLPAQVPAGGLLVVTSNQDRTFDLQASNNEVIFLVGKDKQEVAKARVVSPDGRTIVVTVPSPAKSGEITIKSGGREIGQAGLTLTEPPAGNWLYIVMAWFPIMFFAIILIWLARSLRKDPGWKLGEALSEHLEEKILLRDANNQPIFKTGTQEPIYEVRYKFASSSSRVIAFIGLFAIITGIFAILIPATYWFARTQEVPELGPFSTFLIAQAGIFTPYIANKVFSAVRPPSS